MACDIFTQRRRKRHEYDESWNAACPQNMGMINGVGMTSQFLYKQGPIIPPSKWSWLEGEKILTYLEPSSFEQDNGFYWFSADNVHQIFLRFTGQNFEEEFEPGVFRTNAAMCEILNWDIFPDLMLDLERGTAFRNKPHAFQNVPINIDDQLLPNPFGDPTFTSGLVFNPLKKCHNCVDIP